ncbi:unnamed protein product [Euphydryas editha]|uniref:Uncharacterized protein n=1 Tax=Euphydryas editha TaxID=104508 RepID=A0AAU9TT43_EUPED|nr:unnamed protein product [Euphydryas editha]
MVYFCYVKGCKTEWYPGCGLSFHRFMDASEWMEEENEREEDEQCHSDKENNESRKTPVKKNKTGIVETKKVKE